MGDVAMRIELPETRPPDLEAFVQSTLGVLPEVYDAKRGLSDLSPVVVFVTESFLAGLIGSKGEKALTAVIARLRRRRASDTSTPDTERRLVEVVRNDERPIVTYVFDACSDGDPDAVGRMMAEDPATVADGARLRWDPDGQRWIQEHDD